jgi:hypothetical protein
MELFYMFKACVGKTGKSPMPWKKMDLDRCAPDTLPVRTWEHVRYVLERKHHMHKECNKANSIFSYFEGMPRNVFIAQGGKFSRANVLRSTDVVQPNVALVLWRKPMPGALSRYVPDRFDKELIELKRKADAEAAAAPIAFDNSMTEDEKFALMMKQSAALVAPATDRPYQRRKWKHPSEYELNHEGHPIPPATYTCRGCNEAGAHFRYDCPLGKRGEADAARPLDKVNVPHGIPKAFLRKVDAADREGAMRTKEGEFVVDMRLNLMSLRARNTEKIEAESHARSKKDTERRTNEDAVQSSARPCAAQHDDTRFGFEAYLEAKDKQELAEAEAIYRKFPEARRKIQSMCTHWIRGLCQKGAVLCEYLHIYSLESMPICRFFLEGTCGNDDACNFRHELPPPKREPECPEYAFGFCKLGTACKSRHTRRDVPHRRDFGKDEARFRSVLETVHKMCEARRDKRDDRHDSRERRHDSRERRLDSREHRHDSQEGQQHPPRKRGGTRQDKDHSKRRRVTRR